MSTLALAAAIAFGFASPDALALALGRVTVQSALGEPLRAEIDVPEATPEEVSSLKANIAPTTVFQQQGLEYNSTLSNVTITLQRRPNGSYFLQLASDRPVNEPFVDVILEASWSSGRVQRDFTLLFDPPALRQQQSPLSAQARPQAPGQRAATPPAQGTAPAPAATAPAPGTTAPAPGTAARPTAPAPSAAARPAPARAPATARTPAAEPSGEPGKRVTVQGGDTAGKLAAANKPASVSLDQMLVAMLRANPDAFIEGNVNRLRAGTVMDLPSAAQASSIDPADAHQTLVVQSRDFNEFRRRLAEGVPAAATPSASREASGRVQAQVEDKKPGAAASDRLQLSKGAVQGRGSNADQIARERAARDTQTRVAELNKNIQDLNRITGSTPGAAAGTGSRTPGVTAPAGVTAPPGVSAPAGSAARPGASAPAATARPAAPAAASTTRPASAPVAAAAATTARPASAPAPTVTAAASSPRAATPATGAASAPAAAAPAAASTTTAAATGMTPTPATAPAAGAASAPAAVAAGAATGASAARSPASMAAAVAAARTARPAAKRAPPPPPPEPSLLDDLLENPLLPALGVGLIAVLLGFGFYKMRQKRKTAAVDSSFLESRLQPDSFFGASGGQRIDTAETNNPTGSSMVYSPSQLDAAGDVDPVAEADVYLAYGRDLQAEEILKEALRMNPQRVAIHAKLLEIYAKRRDVKAFEVVAADAYNLTQGNGAEWEHICDLGRELDPANPMYRPGGHPGAGGATAAVAGAAAVAAAASAHRATAAPVARPVEDPSPSDIDLDLDFSLGDEGDTLQQADTPAVPTSRPSARPVAAPAPVAAARAEPAPLEMDFGAPMLPEPTPVRVEAPSASLDDNSLNFEPVAPAPAPKAAPAPVAPRSDMLEFDLGGLSLDLPSSNAPAPAPAARPPVIEPSMSLDLPPVISDAEDGDNPLATKLALAEEFNAIGDADGARSLAEEVVAEASGDLKSRAQRLLAEIG